MLDEFRNISILNHFLQNVTCSMWVMFRGILDNVLSGTKAGFKAILNLEHPFERRKMDT